MLYLSHLALLEIRESLLWPYTSAWHVLTCRKVGVRSYPVPLEFNTKTQSIPVWKYISGMYETGFRDQIHHLKHLDVSAHWPHPLGVQMETRVTVHDEERDRNTQPLFSFSRT